MHDTRLSRPCVYVQRKGEEKTAVCCPVETSFGRCFAVVFGAGTAIEVFLMVLRDKTEDGSDGHGPINCQWADHTKISRALHLRLKATSLGGIEPVTFKDQENRALTQKDARPSKSNPGRKGRDDGLCH